MEKLITSLAFIDSNLFVGMDGAGVYLQVLMVAIGLL